MALDRISCRFIPRPGWRKCTLSARERFLPEAAAAFDAAEKERRREQWDRTVPQPAAAAAAAAGRRYRRRPARADVILEQSRCDRLGGEGVAAGRVALRYVSRAARAQPKLV